MKNIALIAHDHKKHKMVTFVQRNHAVLSRCTLFATATTGSIVKEGTGLKVCCLLSGPQGGDLQIGSKVASGEIDMVIFFRDTLTAQPHEPDITALLRICDVHDIPVATNEEGAKLFLIALDRSHSDDLYV